MTRPTLELNLTPLKAHRLLRDISRAFATNTEAAFRTCLREVEDQLEKHVRYGLRSKRKRS